MTLEEQIKNYINSQPETKKNDMQLLHNIILQLKPDCKLWFLDGKDDQNKTVTNPNIGYHSYTIKYADGKTREFYRVGMSANTSGISIYILGVDDKEYLKKTFGNELGKASVSSYCIKFKTLKDINLETLKSAIRFGFKLA